MVKAKEELLLLTHQQSFALSFPWKVENTNSELVMFLLISYILAKTKPMYLEVHSDLGHCSPLSLECSFLD